MNSIRNQSPMQQAEPVAVHQWRKQGCSDWYDGHPDFGDAGWPYETRTLYTAPPQRQWVGLTDAEIEYCVSLKHPLAISEEVEAKLKEKNT